MGKLVKARAVRLLARANQRPILRRAAQAAALTTLAIAGSLSSAVGQNVDALTDSTANYNEQLSQVGQSTVLASANLHFVNAAMQEGRAAPAWSPNPLDAGHAYLFFVGDAPITWNSNPADVSNPTTDSWRFDPKLQLNTAFQTDIVQAALQSTADLDRYLSDPSADTNGIQSTVKVSLKCAHNYSAGLCAPGSYWASDIVPYLLYQSTLKYDADYSVLKANQNDLGVGLTLDSAGLGLCSPYGAEGTKPACPNPSAGESAYPYASYAFDAQVTRRYSNVGADSDSAIIKTSVTENLSKTFALSFQPNFRARWFDALEGVSREDNTLTLPAAIAWDPPILSAVHPEIRLSANFQRTWSNVGSKAYQQWDVGPLIELIAIPASGND